MAIVLLHHLSGRVATILAVRGEAPQQFMQELIDGLCKGDAEVYQLDDIFLEADEVMVEEVFKLRIAGKFLTSKASGELPN